MYCKLDSFVGVDEVTLTEADMWKFLRDHCVQFNATATFEDILCLYHMHKKSNDKDSMFSEAIGKIQFPLLPASALHFSKLFAPDGKIGLVVDDFDKKGPIETIFRDPSMRLKNIMNFVCLLSSLTHFKK